MYVLQGQWIQLLCFCTAWMIIIIITIIIMIHMHALYSEKMVLSITAQESDCRLIIKQPLPKKQISAFLPMHAEPNRV